MSLLFFSFTLLGFVLFFYGIGLRYLAFLPLLFVGIFLGYHGVAQTVKLKGSEILQRYSLYVARIIILAGLVGIFNYFGMDLVRTALGLLTVNLALRFISYFANYEDGKIVFQLGLYLSMAFLLIIVLALGGRADFFTTFSLLRVLQLAIVAFLIFIIGLEKEVEKYLRYKLGVLSLGSIFLVIFDQIQNVYLALTINSVLLTGFFYLVYSIFQFRPQSDEKKKDISLRRVLAGERITAEKKRFNSKTMEVIYTFLMALPAWTKQVLELFNVIFIIILIIYYITHVGDFAVVNHLLYWAVLASFISNVFFLKKVGYNSIIQNLIVFLVINFAIYISLFSYFNGNIGSVAGRGILRNIFSASMIFYTHKVPMLARIFKKTDYMYRIIASVGAMIVNVILLIKTAMPGELIFFLVLVYLGVQSMVIYYAVRYLERIEGVE